MRQHLVETAAIDLKNQLLACGVLEEDLEVSILGDGIAGVFWKAKNGEIATYKFYADKEHGVTTHFHCSFNNLTPEQAMSVTLGMDKLPEKRKSLHLCSNCGNPVSAQPDIELKLKVGAHNSFEWSPVGTYCDSCLSALLTGIVEAIPVPESSLWPGYPQAVTRLIEAECSVIADARDGKQS